MPTTETSSTKLDDLLVVGGRQRSPQGMRELDERWYGYGQGLLIDVADGEAKVAREYESSPGTYGPGDPVLLKSASRFGDKIYACSQTELLVFAVDDLRVETHISHPVLNDVHHVLPTDDQTLMAAVSGHDLVAEFSFDGDLISMWSVDGSDAHRQLDLGRDYRINCDLKPHQFHPNYLFRHPDGTMWATRFESRDAVQIGDASRRIDIGEERCHDGVLHDGLLYFTTVNGKVVVADPESLNVVDRFSLADDNEDVLLGWCRGLYFTGGSAIVGFSRIRHTKVRGALSWVRNGLTASSPTRIAVYSLDDWTLSEDLNLEAVDCNAVFSILDGRVG